MYSNRFSFTGELNAKKKVNNKNGDRKLEDKLSILLLKPRVYRCLGSYNKYYIDTYQIKTESFERVCVWN